jgi:hypothetical protein
MNHTKASRIDYKIAIMLIVVAALSAVLVASAAGVGTVHTALAKTKSNDGISIPTITKQNQECQTAGGTSPVTGACIATSTNTIDNSGGVVGGG